jgi:multicomponent Na+:H+ antiporter subunit G
MADAWLWLAGVLSLAGAFFVLVAALGVVRLPDLYTRMHAASKAGAVGAGLLFLALAAAADDPAAGWRALAGVAFLLLTTPVAAHLLGRAAYRAGTRPVAGTRDGLAAPPPDPAD